MQRTRACRLDIVTRHPRSLLGAVRPAINSRDQFVRECCDHRSGIAARVLFDHLSVPGRVEVGVLAVPEDRNLVAADFLGFVVQRLGNITEKVDQELQSLLSVR